MNLTIENLIKNKRIKQVNFKFGFDLINRIERYMYDFESNLKSLFPEEAIDTKIPNSFDPQAPRFLLRDSKKKRFLEVSLVSATFKAEIYGDYQKNISDAVTYSKKNINLIYKILSDKLSPSFENLGAAFVIEYSTENLPDIDPNLFFTKKFLNKDFDLSPFHYHFTMAFTEKQKYFVHYKTDSYQVMEGKINLNNIEGRKGGRYIKIPSSAKEINVIDNGIRVTLDINNKLLFQKDKTVSIDPKPNETIEDLFKIASDRIEKLEEFIL